MHKDPTATAKPFIRRFADAEPYEQEEPGDARFAWLLKRDELRDLQIGLVELSGPIHKTAAAHGEWEQAYLILSGTATIWLGDQAHRVDEPALVVIPRNTMHSVQVETGDRLQYLFVNQYSE